MDLSKVNDHEREEDLERRIVELETILASKDAFLQELYAAAGFRIGEQVSVAALVARIRRGNDDRGPVPQDTERVA